MHGKSYHNMGVETHWPAIDVGVHDVRVCYSNDRACLLWRMSFAIGREWENRNMPYIVSPVKRQILLLDEDEANHTLYLGQLKTDYANALKLLDIDEECVEPHQERCIFKRRDVQQIAKCAEQENWTNTPKLHFHKHLHSDYV